MNHIFVYGQFRDISIPLLGEYKNLGRASVEGKIYQVNPAYPGFKRGDGEVWGNVYQIGDKFDVLDEFEGGEYIRTRINTSLGIECWIYEYIHSIDTFKLIKNGDWWLR